MAKKHQEPFLCTLTPETAQALCSVLGQQFVHVRRAAEEGHPELALQFEKLMPFFNALTHHVDGYF